MRVEDGLADRKRSELPKLGPSEKTNKASSKKKKKRQRKSSSMHTGVQKLFETCREVFSNGGAGIVPPSTDVERLRSVLDSMNPADFGLHQDMPYFRNPMITRTPTITYLHLYECDRFSIGIFCLPPSAVIPLHNHPGMTVFSKLLFGSMHVKSYDWADVPENSDKSINYTHFKPPGVRLAKMNTNDVFRSPCSTSVLYPHTGGNMHCFTALTSCAVLDVLGPPYSDSEGRHCAYYCDFPYASFSGDLEPRESEGYAWLEEREKPEDLFVVRAPYKCPKIVEH